jgi:hypothetical protein
MTYISISSLCHMKALLDGERKLISMNWKDTYDTK